MDLMSPLPQLTLQILALIVESILSTIARKLLLQSELRYTW
jgi:hypothetical protein